MPIKSNVVSGGGGGGGAADPLVLANTTSTVGQLQQPSGTRLLHTYGSVVAGERNLFIGELAGNFTNSGALSNIGIGYLALNSLTSGDTNVCVGGYTGYNQIKTSGDNTVIGNYAGAAGASTSDYAYAVFIGSNAGASIAGKSNNAVGIGYLAGGNSNADNYIAIGYNAGRNLIGDGSIAIGYQALDATTTGAASNTAIGYQAGTAVTTGTENTFLGYSAGNTITTGSSNTYIGRYAGRSASVGVTGGTFIGVNAGNNWSGGANTIAIGYNAGTAANTGSNTNSNNIYIGYNSGYSTSSMYAANSRIFIGYESGYNSAAVGAVAIGASAGRGLVGDYSVAIGFEALDATTTGAARNVAVGYHAGTALTTGTNNVFLGYNSGDSVTTGVKNTFIGDDTDGSAVGRTGALALGYKATPALDYVAVFGAVNGAGNSAGELDAIGVGTAAPTLFWQIDERTGMTAEGGFAVKLTNKTGANSVKGDVVCASSTTDNAFQLIAVDVPDPIGVVYTSGVADGSDCWVVVTGRAQVNFIGAATRKYLARGFITGDAGYVAGKALAEALPTSPFATDKHFYEIGHVLETTGGAGLAYVMLHWN